MRCVQCFYQWLSIPFALTNEAVGSITENSTVTWVKDVAPADIGLYIDGFLLLIFGGIPWQVYFQRVLSAKTVRIAEILSYMAAFGCIFMAVPAVLIGAIAANTDWNMTLYEKQENGTIPTSELSLVLPLVLRWLTPDAVCFIGLGAVSAAVMSSTDSSMLSASSMFARNVFGVFYGRATGHKPSDKMTIWIMRGTQLVVAICACAMAIFVNSIYYLFYLCADLVYVVLFPQLTCAVYLRGTNTYGSGSGFILGLLFRLLGGEAGLGLPAAIHFPWYNAETGGQGFPFKTMAMLFSFVGIIGVSYPLKYLFESGKLPMSLDFFHCFSGNGRPTSLDLKKRGEETEVVPGSEVKHRDLDIPPGYQPYVGELNVYPEKSKLKFGHENAAFQSENHKGSILSTKL